MGSWYIVKALSYLSQGKFTMLDLFLHMSDTYIFILLSLLTIVVSVAAMLLVHSRFSLRKRYKDNAAIANASALISIIYGVLAGLMALYLINNITYTTDAVRREANALADLYRDSRWLPPEVKQNIQKNLKDYINLAINKEWNLMQDGKDISNDGDIIINSISNVLAHFNITNHSEMVIVQDMLIAIRNLYDARAQRIQMSTTELTPETWLVIIIGSLLTIAMTFLLGMNFYLHIITVISIALMTSGMLFLLITLDRPFQGEFVVRSDAIQSVENSIKAQEGP